jgi:chromosome condensin MukBEF complex kleisin-like MukF subunit
MVEKLDDMETKLNEQIEKNISLNGRLSEATAEGILDQVSEGLAQTQKEKLASLSESVEFESEGQYREKLVTLKESYFSEKKSPVTKTETLSEGVDESGSESHSNSMSAYMRTLGSFGKN